MSDQFSGEGYSSDPFDERELRQLRHMFQVLRQNFRKLEDEHMKTLELITPVRRAWWFISLVFGLAVAAVHQGWF